MPHFFRARGSVGCTLPPAQITGARSFGPDLGFSQLPRSLAAGAATLEDGSDLWAVSPLTPERGTTGRCDMVELG